MVAIVAIFRVRTVMIFITEIYPYNNDNGNKNSTNRNKGGNCKISKERNRVNDSKDSNDSSKW